MTDEKQYQHGFNEGLYTALALLVKHLEAVPNFDTEALKADIDKLIEIETSRSDSPSKQYLLGFQNPLAPLKSEGTFMSRINALDFQNNP